MLNPLVSVTKIDPSEIPDVSNRFLMRGDRKDDNGNDKSGDRGFGWSKKSVPMSKSGRIIRGRGNFRYRTPSRSRSRSNTPEHWKAAQRNVIKMTDFQKRVEQKKSREEEVNRRIEERKRRHEGLSQGDGKKSFFELSQTAPDPPVLTVASSFIKPLERSGSVDMNALDFEESDSEREQARNFKKIDDKNGKFDRSRSKSFQKRSRSRDRFNRSRSRDRMNRSGSRDRMNRRDFRPVQRNRFDNNRRWDNNRRFDNNRWGNRRSRSRSRSRSR
jgi:peptidyl-prolyl isomerase G (cyclophilin G)